MHVGISPLLRRNELPAHVILPELMGPTGGNMPHGQDAGFLGKTYDPCVECRSFKKGDFGAGPAATG